MVTLIPCFVVLTVFFSPSPKLVLMVLQLCRVALPLMSMTDCNEINLPASLAAAATHVSEDAAVSSSDSGSKEKEKTSDGQGSSAAALSSSRIVVLLLLKLGDFIVPGKGRTVMLQEDVPQAAGVLFLVVLNVVNTKPLCSCG